MKNRLIGVMGLAAFLVVALGGAYYLRAQMGGMNGPRQGQGQAGGMNRPMGMMGGMGGGCAMVVFERHLYVLSGPTLMKVDPSTMKIVKELSIKGKMGAAAPQQEAGEMPSDWE